MVTIWIPKLVLKNAIYCQDLYCTGVTKTSAGDKGDFTNEF